MSDPVIKGAKRPFSRPVPQTTSPSKSSAKSRKVTVSSARPKQIVKRTAAEKAPVRKATPSKSASNAASARSASKTSRSVKQAKVKSLPRLKGAASSKNRAAIQSKTKPATRPAVKQPVRSLSAKKSFPVKVATTKSRPATVRPAALSRPIARPTTALPPPRQPTRDEAAALRAFERAHKEFTRGRFSEARQLFRALIEQHSGVAEVTARARTYLAIAETRLRSESALPRDAEALYDRGVIELNRGEYVAAQEMFERALKRDPEAADVHYALAATRARLGSVNSALQSLARALSLKHSLRVRAQHDPDLVSLRSEPDYERLIFAARP